MGNACCQQGQTFNAKFQISNVMKQSEYVKDQFTQDEYIKQKMHQHRQIFTSPPYKHIHNNKYYWGQWDQGHPIGKGILYQPGIYFYYGNFNIMPHSYGEIEFINSKILYKGQIKQGRANGQGQLTHLQGLYKYDGSWKDSQPVSGILIINENVGTSTNHKSSDSHKTTVAFSDFPNGLTKISYSDGRQYFGNVNSRTLLPQGSGKVTFKNGAQYEGDWADGLFHGEGNFYWADHCSYEGSYQLGKKHGQGKYMYASKKIYRGDWYNGKQSGKGELIDRSGDIVKKGFWKDGKYIGQHLTGLN